MPLYHYTRPECLPSILVKGLRLSRAGHFPGERPCVWFTADAGQEPSAVSSAARVEVEPRAAPHDWAGWRKCGGCAPEVADVLGAVAEKLGSDVSLWRVTFRPVKEGHFVGMDVRHLGAWVRVVGRFDDGEFGLRVVPGVDVPDSPFLPGWIDRYGRRP